MARLIDADALEAKLEEQRKLYIEMDMKGAVDICWDCFKALSDKHIEGEREDDE